MIVRNKTIKRITAQHPNGKIHSIYHPVNVQKPTGTGRPLSSMKALGGWINGMSKVKGIDIPTDSTITIYGDGQIKLGILKIIPNPEKEGKRMMVTVEDKIFGEADD